MLEWFDLCLKLPYLLTYWSVFDLEVSDSALCFAVTKDELDASPYSMKSQAFGVFGIASVASVCFDLGMQGYGGAETRWPF